jgi:predicted Zn-dependent protease
MKGSIGANRSFSAGVALLFFLAAATLSAQTLEEEVSVGKNGHKYISSHFGLYKNKKIQDYVNGIGQKLLVSIDDPEFTYHFYVLEDPMLNAFALPGGYIYVTTGMLAYIDSEAALAGIVGHEIGHVIGHHGIKQMKKKMGDSLLVFAGLAGSLATGQSASSTAAWVVATSQISQMKQLGYGRDLELQADELGMIYSYDAGYDPRESSKFFQTLKFKERVSGVGYHGFSATHPDTLERIIRSQEKSNILINRGKSVESEREKYLKAIEGMSYGKFNRRKMGKPKYSLKLYTTIEGDTFRGIASSKTGDESMAFEIAVMNSMRPNSKLEPGTLLKVPVPGKTTAVGSDPSAAKTKNGKGARRKQGRRNLTGHSNLF